MSSAEEARQEEMLSHSEKLKIMNVEENLRVTEPGSFATPFLRSHARAVFQKL